MAAAEILEARAKRIVSDLRICEFILSNELVSMALAMCAENPAVIAILAVRGAPYGVLGAPLSSSCCQCS